MTSLDSGTESSLHSGMRLEDSRTLPEHDQPEAWEHSILGLGASNGTRHWEGANSEHKQKLV
jgi:hypothetical protein